MNIVLTFDDSYVQHASVLIASVCSNNNGLINFFIMRIVSRNRVPGQQELLKRMQYHYSLTDAQAKYIKTTKRYDPPSSDSGGSSGGGGGGGGSSGSGGGHSF